MSRLAWIAIAYAAGTLPSPYLVALAGRRRDVIAQMRRDESPGDAHFLVVSKMSRALGILAIVLDMVKGFVPALVARATDQDAVTLAWIGLAAVAGHSYPPYFRRAGGRGLTTAAGVTLVLTPKAMVATGIISLAGTVARKGGFGTSIGFALLPAFVAIFGYTGALVAMAGGITALIAIRRMEGARDDRRAGVPVGRILLGRLLFDLPRGKHDL
ncbi:MAG TPA: glycerol-3-phosphate acyltransferase [Actinomycetota bacterium]|nr:glycerol-3-phosphate acyltransferase [Actinomycetota bacterium]